MKKKKVTILLPCLNEEFTLNECIKKIKKQIKNSKYSFNILLCDNGSVDSSVQIAKTNKINVCIEKNKGYGNTLIKGINQASGEYLVMLDSDLSYDESDIIKFVNTLDNGYDLVIGNRFKGKIEKNAMPLSHKIGSKILTNYANILFHTNIKDYHCGLRAFKKDKIKKLNLTSTGMEFASEMIIKAKINNLKMINYPTNYYKDKRKGKPHLKTIRDGLRHLFLIRKLKCDSSIFYNFANVYLKTFLILILLLYGSTFLPQQTIKNNIGKSVQYYETNNKLFYLNNTNLKKDGLGIDYTTDIKLMSMCYLMDKENKLESLIKMNFYSDLDYGEIKYVTIFKNSKNIEEYSRYWQGQTTYLRLLLSIMSAKEIYITNCIILSSLLIYLNILLFKKNKIIMGIFDLSLLLINIYIVPLCLEYYFVFILGVIFSIYIIKNINAPNEDKNLEKLFIVSGITTCFFDFLTCETITLTMPLVLYLMLKIEAKEKINTRRITKYCLLWLTSYGIMYLLKWIINGIYFGINYYKKLLTKINIRVYNKSIEYYKIIIGIYVYFINDLFVFINPGIKYAMGIIILILSIYIYLFEISKKENYNNLLIISIIPVIRFLLLSAHTLRHYYFTYRALLPTLMIIIYIYYLLLNEKEKLWKKRKKYY